MKEYGLDLSKHNGIVDFNAIKKAGNSFVILRAGYGTSTKDKKFEEYYKQSKEAGLKVGAYWYSYALNKEQAKQEAKKFLEVVKGKKFEYPLFLDMEDADGYKKKNGMPSNSTLVDICNTFCAIVEANNYYVGIYASESWFKNKIKGVADGRYDIWLANWGNNNAILEEKELKEKYRLHQFSSNYFLNGKRFDRNICYSFDYEKVIKEKGLNGFSKQQTDNNEETPKKEETNPKLKYKVGDVVSINAVYTSSGSADKLNPYKKKGKITKIIANARNPYLLEDGDIGWVNDSCIVVKSQENILKVGSKVKIKSSAKKYATGEKIPDWVKKKTHTIKKISGEKVLLKEIMSWVHKKDIA